MGADVDTLPHWIQISVSQTGTSERCCAFPTGGGTWVGAIGGQSTHWQQVTLGSHHLRGDIAHKVGANGETVGGSSMVLLTVAGVYVEEFSSVVSTAEEFFCTTASPVAIALRWHI